MTSQGSSSSVKSENNNVPVTALSRSPSPSKKSVIETRRAEQNRAAQRAFRQRKERYVKELEAKVNSMADWPARMEQLELENEQLKRKLLQLEEENKHYKTPKLSYGSTASAFMNNNNNNNNENTSIINTTHTTTTSTTTTTTSTQQQQQIQSPQQREKPQKAKETGENIKVLDDLVSILATRHRPPISSHPPN